MNSVWMRDFKHVRVGAVEKLDLYLHTHPGTTAIAFTVLACVVMVVANVLGA